jgi:hypothetical protein
MRYTWIHAINEPRNFSNKSGCSVSISLKLWLSELRTSENSAATLLCLALMSIQKRIATRWIFCTSPAT